MLERSHTREEDNPLGSTGRRPLLAKLLLWTMGASACASERQPTQARALFSIIQELEDLTTDQNAHPMERRCAPRSESPLHWTHTPRLDQIYGIDIQDAHRKGPEDAPVTIVMWSNFACPFCKLAHATMRELQLAYPNDLRFVFKHNPLTERFARAEHAAIVAEAAGEQGRFWEMHDLLFDNKERHNEGNYRKWAKQLELDLPRFERARKDPALQHRIKRHRAQALALGATGTPAFFINGRYVPGSVSPRRYRNAIEQALKHANRLRARGVSKSDIYAEIIAGKPRQIP